MNYLSAMSLVLVAGTFILMAGIVVMNKESELSPYGFHGTFNESMAWGGSLFVSFGAEFLALGRLF